MAALLEETLRRQGEWLFRNRSWIPVLLLPLVLLAVGRGDVPELARMVWWQVFCYLLLLSGACLRAWVVGTVPEGTSGRTTKEQIAEQLNTTGAYSLLRHPLYAANALMWSGVLLRPAVWWLWVIGLMGFMLLYERIMLAEEAFLHQRFGEHFRRWAEQTPALIPHWRLYRAAERPFRCNVVARREYSTWYAALLSCTIVEALLQWHWTGTFGLPPVWWALLGIATVVLIGRRIHRRMQP